MPSHGGFAIWSRKHGNLYDYDGSTMSILLTGTFATGCVFRAPHPHSDRSIYNLSSTFEVLYSSICGSHEAGADSAHLSWSD